jgi:phosphate transport system substrate-binding protein
MLMRVLAGLVLFMLCGGFAACRPAPPTPHPRVVIRIGGDDAMQLLARDLAEAYHQTHRYATVEVYAGNSNSGLSEFARGSLDLALVSRNPLADEMKQPPARAVEIARDGIVAVVHPSNPIGSVSREQLAKIFSGEILNWSELGARAPSGDADAIQVISREDGSGTRSVFEETIMAGRRVTLTALIQPSERDVLAYVESNPNAVGYAAFNVWNGNSPTRALAIDNVAPTIASIQASTYPLVRTLYLVVPTTLNSEIGDFVDFVLSAPAHALISSRMATVR